MLSASLSKLQHLSKLTIKGENWDGLSFVSGEQALLLLIPRPMKRLCMALACNQDLQISLGECYALLFCSQSSNEC